MLPQFGDNSTQWLTQFPLDAALTAQAQKLVKLGAAKIPPPALDGKRRQQRQGELYPRCASRRADGAPGGLSSVQGQRIMIANAIQLQSALSISHVPNQTRSLDTTLRFPLYQGSATSPR